MEITPHSSDKKPDSDSDKKDKKSNKPARVSRVPLSLAAAEQQRRDAEAAEHRAQETRTEKKKKKSKRSERVDAGAEEIPKHESPKAAERAPKTEPLKLPSPYEGELLVADRWHRKREEVERLAAEQAEDNEDEDSEDGDEAAVAETGEPSHAEAEDMDEEVDEETDEALAEEAIEQPDDEEPAPEFDDDRPVPTVQQSSQPTPIGAALPTLTRPESRPAPGNKYPTPPAPPAPPSWRAFPSPPFNTGGFEQTPAAANVAAVPLAAPEAPQRRHERGSGLVAGILLGGVIEHIRHKRREKRTAKKHTEELRGLGNEQAALRQELTATSQRKTALERQLERLRLQAGRTAETAAAMTARSEGTSPVAAPLSTERNPLVRNARAGQPAAAGVARFESPEVVTARKKLQEALVHEQEEFGAGARALSPDRRLETSAWHHIEVDKETGKPVEDPSVAYGEEFKHEQHQEQLRREIEAASMAGEDVRRRYLPNGSASASVGGAPAGPPNSSLQGQPPPAPPVPQRSAPDSPAPMVSNVVDLVLWGILFVVVIAIIVALSA